MNSASTIVEDDDSDYGFGKSVPDNKIPEEFIEEGFFSPSWENGCVSSAKPG